MGSKALKTKPGSQSRATPNPLHVLVESAEADPRDFAAAGEPDGQGRAGALALPHHRLAVAPGHNPRTRFDRESLGRLAETIASIGLQQPIAVRPARDGRFLVISGERRYRAIGLLIEAGRLPADHPVPVFVREDLDATGLVVAALVENLQREELSPLDEAEAYARLRAGGMGTGELAKAVGRSTRHVQLRMQLLSLVDAAREALQSGEIPVSVARVIAAMPQKLQRRALGHFRAAEAPLRTADALQRWARTEVVPFEAALFDPEAYLREAPDAVFVSDSGGQDPGARGRYFIDRRLFLRLQARALESLRSELGEAYEWVEEHEGWELPERLEEVPDGDGPGAVLLFRKGLFDIRVFRGVERLEERSGTRAAAPSPAGAAGASVSHGPAGPAEPFPIERAERAERAGEAPPSPRREAEGLGQPSLQEAIARDFGLALRLAVAALLTGGPSLGLRLERSGGPGGGAELAPTVRRHFGAVAEALGLERPEELLTLASRAEPPGEDRVVQVLEALPRAAVEGVFAALVASSMAARRAAGGGPAGGSSLLAALARDLDEGVSGSLGHDS